MSNNKFYIYCLFRPWNLAPCYIGKGFGDRYNAHARAGASHTNRHLAAIFAKADETELPCVLLHENLSEEKAFEYERAFIAAIGRANNDTGPLCNLTDGGEGNAGAIFSDERRAKIGAALTGRVYSEETLEKMRSAKLGKKMSDDTCAKMSASHTGLKRSEEHRAKISAALTGRVFSDEHCRNIGRASAGRVFSAEARKKISDAGKRAWETRRLAATGKV